MKNFSEKLSGAIQANRAFVVFRKPDENQVWLFVNDESGKNRFLMHSFDSKSEFSISDDEALSISKSEFNFDFQIRLKPNTSFHTFNKNEYENLIQKTIDEIKNTGIKKIVISRINRIENRNYNLLKSFSKLLNQHPSALVYLFHNPADGTWMGATPELLLSQKEDELKTVSLAGTKAGDADWTNKEIEEQQIVTDYILDAMSGLNDLKSAKTQTIQAGRLQHLKTNISARAGSGFDFKKLASKLHPTPAVCGLPKKEAFDFIIGNEHYNRDFYTGYIGIEQQDSKTYFVNLRCAQFFRDCIRLYVGGGITADSKPEKEWSETELKSGTIINGLV